MVISPELSSMGGSFFSNLVDPEALYRLGSAFFTFIKGSWETAMPILRKGCGVLIMPMIAERNNVGLADTFKVTYPGGSIDCTVAGIGTPAASLSLISKTDGVDFGVKQPFFVFLLPNLGVDPNQLMADLQARLPGLVMNNFAVFNNAWDQAFSLISTSMNALLMLALLAAAMGVVNTTMMSVIERRRELGLLRAIGATRRQTRAVIVGEAALMGLVGGIVGLLAGLGFTVIFVVTYGGNAWGNNNLALWPTALKSAQAAFWVGFVGIIAAPLISAAAAWLPARRILRQNPIETLALE
jgi:putative ABC transport system permease protein